MMKTKNLFMIVLFFYVTQINAAIIRQDVPYKANLFMTIFYDDEAYSASDACTQRPFREVVMMMHGGYFLTGNRSDMNNTCIEFAKKGYAAITIDYRKGGYSLSQCNVTNGYNMIKASYRATQDAISALGFISSTIAEFVPDVNPVHIYAGGFSAGAFTALNIGFVQQEEINADYPLLESELGSLATGNRVYPSVIINNAGAIINLNYINTVNAQNQPLPTPFVINMAAINDPVVPYNEGYFLNCNSHPFLYGTRQITNKLITLDRCYLTVTADIGGHGAFSDAYVVSTAVDFIASLYPVFWGRGMCPGDEELARRERLLTTSNPNQVITIDRSMACDNIPLPMRASSINKKSNEPFTLGTLHVTSNSIQVNIQSEQQDAFKTEVYNLNGQLLYRNNWITTNGNAQVELNTTKLTPGIYLVRVTSMQTNTTQTQKLFITH